MTFASLVCALAPGASTAEPAVDLYIGTYTSSNGSRGIYQARLDTDSGFLSKPELAAEAVGPSFLALHPNGKFLYAVHEPTEGEVSAYEIGSDRKLKRLNTETGRGGAPCHLSVDREGRYLFTAHYTGGNVACFPIRPDGTIGAPTAVVRNVGNGPDKRRQEGPHLHAIYPEAQGRFVYACDLGTDEVLVYRFDPERGTLIPSEAGPGKTPPGGGPRHLALHPNGRRVYVNNEMLNSVSVFARDPVSGGLTETQTIGTLPPGTKTQGKSTAEIALHPNGRWLYVSNRGHDSIAVFEVAGDGTLSVSEIFSLPVAEPRGFAIDPSGRWIVVGGQRSHDLTSLRIDPETGRLSAGPNKVSVGTPVCVVFVR